MEAIGGGLVGQLDEFGLAGIVHRTALHQLEVGAGGLEKSGVSADGLTEAHQVEFDFPQADRDFVVLLTGRPSATSWEFYQFTIATTQLKP